MLPGVLVIIVWQGSEGGDGREEWLIQAVIALYSGVYTMVRT